MSLLCSMLWVSCTHTGDKGEAPGRNIVCAAQRNKGSVAGVPLGCMLSQGRCTWVWYKLSAGQGACCSCCCKEQGNAMAASRCPLQECTALLVFASHARSHETHVRSPVAQVGVAAAHGRSCPGQDWTAWLPRMCTGLQQPEPAGEVLLRDSQLQCPPAHWPSCVSWTRHAI